MNILFLCTGNSCRSQMAEGWARQFAPAGWTIQSAGIEAQGKNPHAIAVMAEAGVDISAQESIAVTDAMFEAVDLVVTVCGHADEHCPVLPAGTRKEHWPLDDPGRASGTREEIMVAFRDTWAEVGERVQALIQRLVQEAAA